MNHEEYPTYDSEHKQCDATSVRANGFAQANGHSQAVNGSVEIDGACLQELDTSLNGHPGSNDVRNDNHETSSEPMECSEEPPVHTRVEINENLPSTSYGKYCAHGHLNMCTIYKYVFKCLLFY